MSAILKNTTPAERFRRCVFAENFENDTWLAVNNGTATGSPSVDFGVTLDGSTQYVTYALTGNEFNSDEISIVIEFYPDFDYDEDEERYLFDTSDSNRYAVLKKDNAGSNVIQIILGFTIIANITSAAYSSYWNVGQRNILQISGTTGSTFAWLNGILILDNDATAWSPKTPNDFYIGIRRDLGSTPFDGKITSVKVFQSLLDAQDAAAYYNNTMYTYMDEAVLNLPMLTAQHDPSNNRTLDVSGKGNHATFGDGSTSSTFPTKLTKRGYSTDGGDYLKTGTGLFTDTGELTMATMFRLGSTVVTAQAILGIEESTTDVGALFLFVSSVPELRFYSGGALSSNAAGYTFGDTRLHTAIGVADGSSTDLFFDGKTGTTASTPLVPGITSNMSSQLFVRGDESTQFCSNGTEIYQGLIWNKVLSSIQVADLHLKMTKQINQV